MNTIDWSRKITAAEAMAHQQDAWATAVRQECSRRISAVLDSHTVANIQGAAIAGQLDGGQMVVFRAGHAWVTEMLATSRRLAQQAPGVTEAEDPWPPLPEGVAALAAEF